MKKIFLTILAFLFLNGCQISTKTTCAKCIEINFGEVKQKQDNLETFVLLIKNDECSICQQYNYILDKYLKTQNQVIYYIDSSLLDLNNININDFIEEIKKKAGVNDNAILPSSVFIYKGEIINVEIGVLSIKELQDNIDLLYSI